MTMQQPNDPTGGINFNEHQLLAHLVIDDALARRVLPPAMVPKGENAAFLRGFVLKHRSTGTVWFCYRFLYGDGRRSWYGVKDIGNDTVEDVKRKLEFVFTTAMRHFGVTDLRCEWHCPPDDGGDPAVLTKWMQECGLFCAPRLVDDPNVDERWN
jgi:hypothetical protein